MCEVYMHHVSRILLYLGGGGGLCNPLATVIVMLTCAFVLFFLKRSTGGPEKGGNTVSDVEGALHVPSQGHCEETVSSMLAHQSQSH